MKNVHGGDIYEYYTQQGKMPLDFSANINPLGMPKAVRKALEQSIDQCVHYPDPFCHALRQAIAARWNLSPQSIFCGNGASEIFYRIIHCILPQRALILAPTFSEYESALKTVGCIPKIHLLKPENNFMVTKEILKKLRPNLELLILCNPNNPTGSTIDPELLERILFKCYQNQTWVILDECFCDFLQDASQYTMVHWLSKMKHFIIVRAFTKMYAIPGVRLGWCMTENQNLIENLYTVGCPWNVSVPAQNCGIAALTCQDWEVQTAKQVAQWRTQLAEQLETFGFHVFPSQANYLFFYTNHIDLADKLRSKNIMIRSCANYRGLEEGYFRVAVRPSNEQILLKQAIEEILWQKQS